MRSMMMIRMRAFRKAICDVVCEWLRTWENMYYCCWLRRKMRTTEACGQTIKSWIVLITMTITHLRYVYYYIWSRQAVADMTCCFSAKLKTKNVPHLFQIQKRLRSNHNQKNAKILCIKTYFAMYSESVCKHIHKETDLQNT